jgi:predicted RNA-binding protein YlqC (UPF0109 family)
MLELKKVLTDIAKAIVDDPDSVNVTETEQTEGNVLLVLTVAPDDMGMVIGKKGRIAKSIRTIMKVAANAVGKKVTVEIQ